MTSSQNSQKTPQPGSAPSSPPDNRKRTVAITLLAVGAGAVTIGALSGVGSSGNRTRTFPDVATCEAQKQDTSINCGYEFNSSYNLHERNAPTYPSRQACETEFGANNCTQPSSASGRAQYFIPAMAAFMIGPRSTGGFQSAPLYRSPRDPANEFRQSAAFPYPVTYSSSSSSSSSGRSFWNSSGSSTSSPTTTSRSSTSSPVTTTSRGGFGSSAHSSSGS